MSSSVSVALIAAASAVTGSAVTFIGSIWSARSVIRQGEAQIAADHAAWLRDRRADIYLQMTMFLREAGQRRFRVIRDGEATIELMTNVAASVEQYESIKTMQLSVDGTTFIGQETARAFDKALIINVEAWQVFLRVVQDGMNPDTLQRRFVCADEVTEALQRATLADKEVFQLIKLDVSWTEYSRKHLRTRRRARRRQVRQIRKLEKSSRAPYIDAATRS